jgi:hypothetical protein
MLKARRTLEQVLTAIRGSSGIKTVIAQTLNVSRPTVDKYLLKFAQAQKEYEAEVNRMGDVVESVIITAINRGDLETAKWYASKKLKDRGYVDRQEIAEVDPLHAVRKVVFEVAQPLQGVEKKNGDGIRPSNGTGHKPALEGNA